MARVSRVTVEIEDVNGSFARLVKESPKIAKRYLSTAVFETAGAVQQGMEARMKLGPEGEGATPYDHIKLDVEHRGRNGSLSARVGIFDDEAQVAVATYQEYGTKAGTPRHPAMKESAQAESEPFKKRAMRALEQCARDLERGSGVGSGSVGRQAREGSGSSGVSRFATTGRL